MNYFFTIVVLAFSFNASAGLRYKNVNYKCDLLQTSDELYSLPVNRSISVTFTRPRSACVMCTTNNYLEIKNFPTVTKSLINGRTILGPYNSTIDNSEDNGGSFSYELGWESDKHSLGDMIPYENTYSKDLNNHDGVYRYSFTETFDVGIDQDLSSIGSRNAHPNSFNIELRYKKQQLANHCATKKSSLNCYKSYHAIYSCAESN